MVSVVLDLLVVGIVVASIVLAYRKGLIRTLFSLLGGILAITLAVSFSAPFATWLNASYVGPAVRNSVLAAINEEPLEEDYETSLATVNVSQKLQNMPNSLREFLESIQIDPDQAKEEAEKNEGTTVSARAKLLETVTDPISETISKTIAIILLFILFFIILFIISLLLGAVFKVLPFGRSLNRVGGILLGALRGLLLAMLFGMIVHSFASFNNVVSFADIENTWLLKYINQINPIF